MKTAEFLDTALGKEIRVDHENSALLPLLKRFNSTSSFSVISAEGAEDSSALYHELKRVIRLKRYGMIELAVIHGDRDKKLSRVLAVPMMTKKDLVSVAQLYSQKSVLTKRMDGVFALKLKREGPPDLFVENLIYSPGVESSLSAIFSHMFPDIHSIYERRHVSVWVEWYISLKREGDDSRLWMRIE